MIIAGLFSGTLFSNVPFIIQSAIKVMTDGTVKKSMEEKMVTSKRLTDSEFIKKVKELERLGEVEFEAVVMAVRLRNRHRRQEALKLRNVIPLVQKTKKPR